MKRKMKSFMDKNYDHHSNLDSRYNNNNNQKELYPNVPIPLTDYNFNESIDKYRFLIVDFWAAWCGPCRMISPIIEQLSLELAGKVVFGKLNVDENPYVSNAFEIKSIPTII